MRTTTPRPLTAGLLEPPGTGRPPHPGGRPCGGLCVPACAADPHDQPSTTPTQGDRP